LTDKTDHCRPIVLALSYSHAVGGNEMNERRASSVASSLRHRDVIVHRDTDRLTERRTGRHGQTSKRTGRQSRCVDYAYPAVDLYRRRLVPERREAWRRWAWPGEERAWRASDRMTSATCSLLLGIHLDSNLRQLTYSFNISKITFLFTISTHRGLILF